MIGFALSGSFCNFEKALTALEDLASGGEEIVPVMSYNSYNTDTRFGKAEYFISRVEDICKRKVIHTLTEAEPLGPKVKLDCLCICPCTGNTLSKIASGIYDTPVTLAAKAHLRSSRPLVIALATNDALSGNAESLSKMLVRKNVYFVPMTQDDFKNKPYSLVCDFAKLRETVDMAKNGEQIQPLFF